MLAQDRAMIEQLQRRQPRESVRKKPPTPPKVERGNNFHHAPPQNKSVIDWQLTFLKHTWGCMQSWLSIDNHFQAQQRFIFSLPSVSCLSKSTTFVPVSEYQRHISDMVWFLTPQVSPYKFRLDTAPPSPSNESDQVQGFSRWMRGVFGFKIFIDLLGSTEIYER